MSRNITHERATIVLATLWIFFFLLSLAVPLWLFFLGAIEQPAFTVALDGISALYVPYLGAVLAFYFATRNQPSRAVTRQPTFVIALVVSAVWNIIVCSFIIRIPLGLMPIEEGIKVAGESGARLSWVVAPAMGYYFGKSGETS
ncbi:MAG: hypothetical protein WCC87_19900 [Candidatus Korobacteraceae bacterium]